MFNPHTYRCGMYEPEGTHKNTFPCDCPCHGKRDVNLYKIIFSGDTADMMFGNMFSDDLFFLIDRASPIVTYAYMSDRDAVEIATRPDFEVTRARTDWSI